MNRIFSLLFAITLSMAIFSQQSELYSSQDAAFRNARDLYLQHKYSISYNLFQEIEIQLPSDNSILRNELEYYMAANAFALRLDETMAKLQAYSANYPYTPYESNVHFMKGMLYIEQKDMKSALSEFQQITNNQLPAMWQIDFEFHYALAYVETNQYEKACRILPALLEQKTRYNTSAKYLYAYSLYQLKHYQQAKPLFLEVENTKAYSHIAPYYLIQILHKENDAAGVLARAEKLLKENPKNPNNSEIYRILGEVYYDKADYENAIIYLVKYDQSTVTHFRNDMYILGLSYFKTEQYAKAIEYLSQVTTQSDLTSENAYLHLGNSYVKIGDKNNARMAYQNATLTKFDESVREEAMFNYALTTYEMSTALGESVGAFTNFLKEYPNSKYSTRTYELLVNVLLGSKNYKAAYDAIADIQYTSPQLTEAKEYLLYQLGTDAFANNQYSQAIESFTQALALNSGKYKTECYFWRSESYYRTQMYAKSVADLTQYFRQSNARSNKNYLLAHYSAGYSYFALKQYDSALNYFLKYVSSEQNKSNQTYADALNRLGDCYFNDRNFAQANRYYEQVVALNAARADYAAFQKAYVFGLQKKYIDKIKMLSQMQAKYPNSELLDDALYEMARAYLMQEENQSAIEVYERLLSTYPNSNLTRKTALEIGMIHFNVKDYDKAVAAYKNVVANYAGSEEAFMALDGMEAAYIHLNNISDYLTYLKTLSGAVALNTSAKEDSLIYIAAENQYIQEKYKDAAAGFNTYLEKFCPGGRYCVMSYYYLATSYYRLDEKENALKTYQSLIGIEGNQFMEEAYMRSAELSFDLNDFANSLKYFEKLQNVASTPMNTDIARLGILRCSKKTNDNDKLVAVATQIIDDERSSGALLEEAHYGRAHAYIAQNQNELAIPDLEILSEELRTAIGAESKYLLANIYFQAENFDEAESEIMDFANKNTPQQFWLARSFVLLADIYLKKGEDFQAKQYLLSVQNNYKAQDEIQTLINERLELIAEREKERIVE